jgi:DNA-binding NarL/FixJ family response regulator
VEDEDRLQRLSPKMRAVHELDLQGLTPAEIGKRLLLSEFAVRTFLEVIEERLNPPPDPDLTSPSES